MPVPKRNPRKEPMADFKEAAASFCANAISPMNAPPQAPIMIPHGCGKKMPIMSISRGNFILRLHTLGYGGKTVAEFIAF